MFALAGDSYSQDTAVLAEILLPEEITSVRQWIYKPHLLDGEPVEVDTQLTVNFSFSRPSTPRHTNNVNTESNLEVIWICCTR